MGKVLYGVHSITAVDGDGKPYAHPYIPSFVSMEVTCRINWKFIKHKKSRIRKKWGKQMFNKMCGGK